MQGTDGIIDRKAALDRLGGDEELLDELVVIFVEQVPQMLSDIRDAVARNDSKALQLAAHSMKGSAANLSALGISEAARQLEMMGRQGDLTQSREVFSALEAELSRLQAEFGIAA